MSEPDLLRISIVALLAVFTVLGVLAVLMHLLTRLLPVEDDPPSDPALVAAVHSAAAAAFPGMRVTNIRENR